MGVGVGGGKQAVRGSVDLGRCERLASPAQRLALIARDKGCTRPGCETPASMCAVHHVTDWVEGGPTDLNNLTLACDHCHALVNDSAEGWKTVVMGKDSPYRGRTGWIAPRSLDPTGTPRVTTDITSGSGSLLRSNRVAWGGVHGPHEFPAAGVLTGVRGNPGSVAGSSALPDLR
ncbi:HNH endonuclease signature motif containing protein [Nocardia niigatensis]